MVLLWMGAGHRHHAFQSFVCVSLVRVVFLSSLARVPKNKSSALYLLCITRAGCLRFYWRAGMDSLPSRR